MPRRKTKYKPKSFESIGQKFKDENNTIRTDTTANIYESMLLSPAFQDLKHRQRNLYVVCKAQYYGHRKPKQDNPDVEQLQNDCLFYLNWYEVMKYGIYTKTMKKEFYGDLKALEQHGFIDIVVRGGKNGKTKSIYKYSDKWKCFSVGGL